MNSEHDKYCLNVLSNASGNSCYGECSVDKEGQNLLVDVEEIFESLLNVQELGEVLLEVGKVPD